MKRVADEGTDQLNYSECNPSVSALAKDDDGTLVAAAKAGDVAAFEELVGRYERKIFRLAQNMLWNREDAEDVMQEAFLKSFQRLGDFRGDSRFYTWLVRITINEALMKLRKRRPSQVSLDKPLEGEDGLLPREIEDWGPTPEQRYGQKELDEILSRALGQLEPGNRIVFQMRDVEGLSAEETAQLLGLSVPAVKARLFRARLTLREKLNRSFRRSGLVELQTRNWPRAKVLPGPC
jgi:RNA polymerase sigma-70 factor (ECF subfamily)